MKTLALLHTTIVTALPLKELAGKELPGTRVINLVDDSLLADVMAAEDPARRWGISGGTTPAERAALFAAHRTASLPVVVGEAA